MSNKAMFVEVTGTPYVMDDLDTPPVLSPSYIGQKLWPSNAIQAACDALNANYPSYRAYGGNPGTKPPRPPGS